eukprot:3801830-Alexandrium_andersonii.AAC.1
MPPRAIARWGPHVDRNCRHQRSAGSITSAKAVQSDASRPWLSAGLAGKGTSPASLHSPKGG